MITIRKSAQTCQRWQWYPCCSWIGTAWERRGRPEGYRPFVTEKDVIIDPSLLRSAHHCFANTLIIVFYVKICEMSCLLSACRCSLSNQLSTSPQCLNGINFPVHDRLQACLSKGIQHEFRIFCIFLLYSIDSDYICKGPQNHSLDRQQPWNCIRTANMGISWLLKPVALVSTVALSTLGVLSRRYQRARLYFNITIYVSTLGLMSVWGVVVSILATAAGQVCAYLHCVWIEVGKNVLIFTSQMVI